MKWSEQAWLAAEPVYHSILEHPFVKELSAGTLPMSKFEYYLQQDALYLGRYTAALAHIASRLRDIAQVETFIGFANDGIAVERAMHEVFLQKIADRQYEMSPTCLLYTSLITSCREAPVEVEAAAVLPCFWIYLKVGQYILAGLDKHVDNPYRRWIDTYSDETFAVSTQKAIDICDSLAGQAAEEIRRQMTLIFVRCSKMEWMFWDSAYNLEQWKI